MGVCLHPALSLTEFRMLKRNIMVHIFIFLLFYSLHYALFDSQTNMENADSAYMVIVVAIRIFVHSYNMLRKKPIILIFSVCMCIFVSGIFDAHERLLNFHIAHSIAAAAAVRLPQNMAV